MSKAKSTVRVLLIGASAALLLPTAQAQSSVTIYGLLNLAVVKEARSSTKVDRGYMNWLGFTGQEDLGDGLAATFNIMTRFAPDTGTNESEVFWHGESTVGLKSNTLGSLRLGRAMTPMFSIKWQYEPWGDSWMMGSLGKYQAGRRFFSNVPACLSTCPGFARINNGVFYDSPTFGGVQLRVASQAEIETGATRRNVGVAASFAAGALNTMLSYERNTTNGSVVFGAAKYDFGGATLMGSLSQDRVTGAENERNVLIAGTVELGGASSLRAGYGRNTSASESKGSLGYIYSFSKRTSAYADVYSEKTTVRTNGGGVGLQHTF